MAAPAQSFGEFVASQPRQSFGAFVESGEPAKPSLLSDAAKYSPIGMVQGIAEMLRQAATGHNPLAGQAESNEKLFEKAKDSFHQGDYTGAAAHFLNYLVPGGGAFEDAGEDFQKGDTARGIAKTAGLASGLIAGTKAPEILQTTGRVADSAANAARIATNPEVIREGVRIIPKGGQAVKFYDAIQNAKKPPVPAEETGILEDLSRSLTGKSFRSLGSDAQDEIRRYAAHPQGLSDSPARPARPVAMARSSNGTPAAQLSAAPRVIVPDTPPDASYVRAVPAEYGARVEPPVPPAFVPKALLPESSTIITAPPEDGSFVRGVAAAYPEKIRPGMPPSSEPSPITEPTPAALPKSDMESILEQSLESPKITEAAKAELDAHLKQEGVKKVVEIIDSHQVRRALRLGRFLQDYGITPDHLDSMTEAEWHQVGELADVPKPSATTIKKTKDLLSMGQ